MITICIVLSKSYDKHDDFNCEIVHFPFLDEDFPCSPCCAVYILYLFVFLKFLSLSLSLTLSLSLSLSLSICGVVLEDQ